MCLPDIPLEDDACDIIAKAMHGRNISSKQLAKSTNQTESSINSILQGHSDDNAFRLISHPLELSSAALIGISGYQPRLRVPDGLIQIVSPFGHAGVNAYLIVQDKHAIAFDTGTDATPLFTFLNKHQLTLDCLYITHRHHDHLADVKKFNNTRIIYPEHTKHGQKTNIFSGESLLAIDVSGHANPARAYYYDGLSSPVCIVGDSVFAGSMGKSPDTISYKQALKTARVNLMSLPPSTILCPGHGPITTVALEQKHNPFLAKRSNEQ